MMISRNAIFTLALVAGLMLIGGDVLAQGAGKSLFEATRGLVTGNIGLMIGLILAVWGIWTWVVKQETMAGIMMIVGGVLISIAPGVMNFVGGVVAPVIKLGGADTTKVNNQYENLIELK